MIRNSLPIVRGEVVFTKSVQSFSNATVYIQLEDISIADAGAWVLGSQTIGKVQHDPNLTGGNTIIPFDIYMNKEEEIDQRNFYAVRVRVNFDNSEMNSRKDLDSDQIFRVLTHGFGNFIRIEF